MSTLPRLVVSLGFALVAAGCAQPFRATVDRRITQTAGRIDALVVETDNGSVTLETDLTLAEIAVDAQVTGSGESEDEARARAEEATVQFELRDEGRTARVYVTFPGDRRPAEGCSFVIRAPRVLTTRIDTGNGDVRVAGTAGDLAIDTSNGGVVVDRHEGTVAIETSNGNLRLTGISGEVTARTSNGSIVLDAGTGSIARFDLDTSNGGVEVALGPGFAGTIDAATSNGSVDCRLAAATVEGSRSEKSVRVGDGPRCRVRTSNGSIVLR